MKKFYNLGAMLLLYANTKDAGQHAHPRRLVSDIVVRLSDTIV